MANSPESSTVGDGPLTDGDIVKDMASLVVEYLRTRVKKGEIDSITARTQRPILMAFATTYGDRPAHKLSRRHINRWLETRGHLKPSTRRTQHSILRGFTAWLLESKHIPVDPMRGVKPPRQPRTVPRTMPSGEVGQVLRHAPDSRGRAILSLAVGCGLRCVEIARLNVEDWDRQNDILRVIGKGGHERELPVPQMVRRHLLSYLVEYPASVGPLLRSYRDGFAPLKPQTISMLMNQWMRDSGVKITPYDGRSAHALRHTFASDVLDNCGDLRVVQDALGHRNLSTTSIYVRRKFAMEQMRAAMGGRDYISPEGELSTDLQPTEEP